MTGATSRNKGHRFEVAVANYLTGRGIPAATTRSRLGHGGTLQPGDVLTDPLHGYELAVECKNVANGSWPQFVAQAVRQATPPRQVPVVVRKKAGTQDPGRATTLVPSWYWRGNGTLSGDRPTVDKTGPCSAELWVDRFGLVTWTDDRNRRWTCTTLDALCTELLAAR